MASRAPHTLRTSRRASAIALLCGCAVLSVGVAVAQQANGLRGAVLEREINNDLLGGSLGAGQPGRNTETGITPRTYTPSSPGADAGRTEPSALADPLLIGDPLQGGRRQAIDPGAVEEPLARQPAPRNALADEPLPAPRSTAARRASVTRAEAPTGVASPRQPTPARVAEPELATGTVPAGAVDSLDDDRSVRIATDNARETAIDGLSRRPEDNPYAPLGIRAGTFVVTPTLEQGATWTSNARSEPNGRSALLSETTLRLDAISDWSRHSAALRADGTFRRSVAGERVREIEGGVEGDLRLDLSHDYRALASLGYRIAPESASSPINLGAVTSQPLRHTMRGSAGISKDLAKLRVALTGDVERNRFDDASLAGGGTLSQRDRDNTLASMRLRTGYEISPAIFPFVEAEYGRRFYDLKRDANGYRRSGDRYGLRAGVELDLGEKLAGEVSAGWLTERPQDGRLRQVSGLTLASNLAWSPMRGTTVGLDGSTEVEAATDPGASGSLLYRGSLSLTRELRHNLTARALLGLEWRDYSGSNDRDVIMLGEVGLTWWMNRYAGITGRLRHERQASTLAGRTYNASSVYLGMTLQR